jgi:hypothetical protein
LHSFDFSGSSGLMLRFRIQHNTPLFLLSTLIEIPFCNKRENKEKEDKREAWAKTPAYWFPEIKKEYILPLFQHSIFFV